MERKKDKSLLRLFLGVFTVSAFTFGGGFVIVTFFKKKFVDEYGWLREEEMLDYIALAQSAPGSIAVNAAVLLGWNTLGFPGMVTAVLAAVLPPMAVLTVLSACYDQFAQHRVVSLVLKGMQAGVAAVILDAALSLGQKVVKEKSLFHICLAAGAFIAVFFLKINVIPVIAAALAAGLLTAAWKLRGGVCG